ncbi:DNA_pol_B_2 domain-containing protein [Trichonephila clavipes]|nr:DNA_pol_B_2 domain-containing protein [Trichonephila clavipes]
MCDNCREWVDKDHICYMKMKNAKGGLCEYSCSKMGKERLCVCCKKTEACLKTCQKLLKYPDWCDQCKYGDFSEKYFFFDVETMQETGKHKVNLVVNHDFKGKYPHEDYYGYQSMTIKQRETFMEWYETVKDEIFDFRKEIMKYCDSDVYILRRGCLEMRKLFLKIADIDPFRYVTLAGVCMAIYRSKFLKEGTIAIDEDIKQDVYSKKSIACLCKSCSKTIKCKHKNEVGKPKSAVEKKKCKECYEIRNKECNHTDEERSFIGTWTTTEVKLAIQKGYEILNVYEVWNFNSKSKDLFRDYVKMFLKIKLETDDKWNFKTEEEYRRYVKEKLDIELGKIEKNPGLRFIAKICLNSLWGKFEQRKNMQQTEYVMELEDFYRIVLNDAIKDLNMIFLKDDCVEMQYKMKDEYAKDNFNTNVYVAAFTTSSARIRLYEIMDKLG